MIARADTSSQTAPLRIGRAEMLGIAWAGRGEIRVRLDIDRETYLAVVPAAALASPGAMAAAVAGEIGIIIEWTPAQLRDWPFALRKSVAIGALQLRQEGLI